jgi:hypothetical protein
LKGKERKIGRKKERKDERKEDRREDEIRQDHNIKNGSGEGKTSEC